MTQVFRIDFAEAPIRMERTDEGYLRGRARIARIGIQAYQDGQGGIRRELRLPEDVFAADALASFAGKPITLGHPPEALVTADNAKRLAVGHIGETITVDGDWIVAPLTITDSDTINRIEETGTVELSAGYRMSIDEMPGEYMGQTFDAVQRGIRGNHVAIVDRGRAGPEARLNLDAADAVAVTEAQEIRSDDMSDKSVTVRVDGIEYSVPPEVERHIAKLDEAKAKAEGDLEAAKTQAETTKAKLDEATAEVERVTTERSDEAIRAAARERVALERSASKVVGDADFDRMSDREIREAVVKHIHKDAKLDDASDVYVQARFDAALETHTAHGDALSKQRETAVPRQDAGGGKNPEKEAMDDIRSAYKRRDKGTYKDGASRRMQ